MPGGGGGGVEHSFFNLTSIVFEYFDLILISYRRTQKNLSRPLQNRSCSIEDNCLLLWAKIFKLSAVMMLKLYPRNPGVVTLL